MEHPELCPMFQEPHHRRKRSANDDHEGDGHSDTNNNEDSHDTEHSNVGVLALYLLIVMFYGSKAVIFFNLKGIVMFISRKMQTIMETTTTTTKEVRIPSWCRIHPFISDLYSFHPKGSRYLIASRKPFISQILSITIKSCNTSF